jgi:hypothetical protein
MKRIRTRQRGDVESIVPILICLIALIFLASLSSSRKAHGNHNADLLTPRGQWELVGYDKPGPGKDDCTYRLDRTVVPGGWLYRTIPVTPDGVLYEGHAVTMSFVPLPAEMESLK